MAERNILNPCFENFFVVRTEKGDPLRITILYQDDALVAVHKPSGLLVHRTGLEPRDTVFLLQSLRNALGRHVYPVHRLDRPTSGVMVFALNPEIAGILGRCVRCHDFEKTYVALVRGNIPLSGTIAHPLRPGLDRTTTPRFSRTRYHRILTKEVPVPMGRVSRRCYSLVELHPDTGRKHQLRRHLKHISHPIIGDTRYGDGRHNRFFRSTYACHRLMLAATEVSFLHPVSGNRLCIRAPFAADFLSVLHGLGWNASLLLPWVENGGGSTGTGTEILL